MACVSFCLLHCSEEEECAIRLSDESVISEIACSDENELVYTNQDSCCEPDCCPMKPMPVCGLQRDFSSDYQANNDYQISPLHYSVSANSIGSKYSRGSILHSSSDPPFERLCMLRI
jgi:hypothetical protein